jgi:hypothetical protein
LRFEHFNRVASCSCLGFPQKRGLRALIKSQISKELHKGEKPVIIFLQAHQATASETVEKRQSPAERYDILTL